MPRRLQREGDSLQAILADARQEFGPGARIVAAERTITGGIAGFFGREHYVATVEVPSAARRPPRLDPVRFDDTARVGIAALLADADADDKLRPGQPRDPGPQVSTEREDFNELLERLVENTSLRDDQDSPVPAPPRGAGDVIALVGLGPDAVQVAGAMAAHLGMLTASAGTAAGDNPVRGRSEAVELRARGVRQDRATAVGVGVGVGVGAEEVSALLAELGPDQTWVVVDAGRKAEDTERWVQRIRRVTTVDGLAVVGTELTATPETVNDLGVPIGWVESVPAVQPYL